MKLVVPYIDGANQETLETLAQKMEESKEITIEVDGKEIVLPADMISFEKVTKTV